MSKNTTIYSDERVLCVVERSWTKLLAEINAYEKKGWVVFDPPFNVVFRKELRVGKAANHSMGKAAYMCRKNRKAKLDPAIEEIPFG